MSDEVSKNGDAFDKAVLEKMIMDMDLTKVLESIPHDWDPFSGVFQKIKFQEPTGKDKPILYPGYDPEDPWRDLLRLELEDERDKP